MKKNTGEPIDSPCIKDCRMGWKGYCIGCFRSLHEISKWQTLTDRQRTRIVAELSDRKAAYRAAGEK